MSNLPNSVIRLVPPTLRGGYCPDSWTEFARTVVGGTSAQINLDRGSTFYNFGNQPVFPTPTVPCDYDLLIDVEPANTDFSSKIGWVSVNQLEPASGVTEINFDGSGVISGGCTMAYLDGVTKISYPNATEFAPANWGYGVSIQRMPDLTEFNAPLLQSTALIRIQLCPLITSLSFPALTTGFAFLINSNIFIITDNVALTDIDLGAFTPLNMHRGRFTNNALTASTVNHILARFVSSPTWANILDLSGGSNAAPTGQGIVDKATLIGRGATVTTN